MGKKICIYENNVDKTWYDSSTVFYSECDDKENALKELKVVFKNGSTYLYKDVNVNDYLLFRESASQGKTLHRIIKQYAFEKLENTDMNLLVEEYNKVIDRLNNAENEKQTVIISAFPGCGKSTTYERLKNQYNIVDLESSFFDKSEFPQNYIQKIKDNIGKTDIIFISTHEKVRKALQEENIEYVLYYPNIDRRDEMINLYERRGNEGTFIDLMTIHFDHFISNIENDSYAKTKICLQNEGDFIINDEHFNNILKTIIN